MGAPFVVVMAGGSGTRFWPKSTAKRPKQLLSFGAGESLLASTFSRFAGLAPANRCMVVTTQLLHEAVTREVQKGVQVLAEPQGRNTAPCVYWAARVVAEQDPRGVMLVMPSDHYVPDLPSFRKTVEQAVEWARSHDDLVTLGIRPSRPETGYGYLRTGAALKDGCLKVDAFVEKPGIEKAREFLAAGNYLWNGGMFVWRADVILRAFDAHMPEMKKAWDGAGGEVASAYPKLTATSIDYGVMEKSANVVTFPLDCGWDDLGSWTSLENLASALGAEHAAGVVTSGDCVSIDSKDNIVDTPDKLVALLGVEGMIVVEAGGAILIARKDRAQDIRRVVDEVKRRRPDLA